MKHYKRICKEELLQDNHNVEISMDMPEENLIDALFMASEDENVNQFKRGWVQLSSTYKRKFIDQFKGKYTHDTMDKMFFILKTIV